MRPEDVYSPTSVQHPVLDQLLGGGTPAAADSASARLLVLDASNDALASDGSLEQAVNGSIPVLLLNASTQNLAALSAWVATVPADPQQAVLVASAVNSSGLRNYQIAVLGYELEPGEQAHEEVAVPGGGGQKAANPNTADSVDVDETDHVLHDFVTTIENRASEPLTEPMLLTAEPIPTGLKYFNTISTVSTTFKYKTDSGGTQSGDGSLTLTLSIWGFLSQSATQNQQYLVVQSSYNINPGKMKDNDSEGRGYVDAYINSGLKPPMTALQHQPINGKNTWSGQVRFPVSYANPLGGYSIWYYDETVAQSIDKWSVKGNSNLDSLGSFWYFNSPCDGSNVSGSWKSAFTDYGHVEGMSGGSTGTLNVQEISAWFTNTLYKNTITMTTSFGWQGTRFWATDCFLGICYTEHNARNTFTWTPSFTVNMAPINP